MEFTLVLIRHGESKGNRDKIVYGVQCTGLNERGKDQAAKAGQFLQSNPIQAAFSSDTLRARETATIIVDEVNRVRKADSSGDNRQKLSLVQTELLRERDLGEAEGKTYDSVKAMGTKQNTGLRLEDLDLKGSETKEQMLIRLRKFVETLISKAKETCSDSPGEIVAVSHGLAIKMFIVLLMDEHGMEPPLKNRDELILAENTAMSRFRFTVDAKDQVEKVVCEKLHQASHLEGVGGLLQEHSALQKLAGDEKK